MRFPHDQSQPRGQHGPYPPHRNHYTSSQHSPAPRVPPYNDINGPHWKPPDSNFPAYYGQPGQERTNHPNSSHHGGTQNQFNYRPPYPTSYQQEQVCSDSEGMHIPASHFNMPPNGLDGTSHHTSQPHSGHYQSTSQPVPPHSILPSCQEQGRSSSGHGQSNTLSQHPPCMPLPGPSLGMPPPGPVPGMPPPGPLSGMPSPNIPPPGYNSGIGASGSPSSMPQPHARPPLSWYDASSAMQQSESVHYQQSHNAYQPLPNEPNKCVSVEYSGATGLSQHSHQQHKPVNSDQSEAGSDALHGITKADLANGKQADKKWIEGFTKKNRLKPEKPKMGEITIPKAHVLLKEALHLQCSLQKMLCKTKGHEDKEDDDIYTQYISIKKRLEEIKAVFADEKHVASLKTRIWRARSKRENLRRRQTRIHFELDEMLARRQEIESKIDQWQAGLIQKELDTKKTEELKLAADRVLAEVSRKQLEATRCLDMLEALTKLRNVRLMKAEQKGVYASPAAEEMFKKRLHGLRQLLDIQLATYKEEDKALRVMMDIEQEETKEREKASKQLKEDERRHMYKENIMEFLFGKTKDIGPDDPLYSYRQYYESAQHNIEDFVKIRHDWDVYAMSANVGGSSLPVTWVVPTTPSNETWASALEENHPKCS